MYVKVHGSIIHNSPKVGTTQMSIDEWINKTWSINRMEYYSAIKRNEVLIYVTIWRKLEYIMLNARSHKRPHIL